MDRYEFDGSTLWIQDQELGINLQEKFSPLLVPPNPIPGTVYHDHVIKMDLSGGHYLEKEDIRDGQSLLYYPDGTKKMECYYIQGLLHGPSTFFSESGGILAKSWFFHGKQEGKCHWYYPSGSLYSLQRYLDGKWHLIQEYFYEDGQIKSAIFYKQGILDGTTNLYNSKGQLERSIHFKNGKKVT